MHGPETGIIPLRDEIALLAGCVERYEDIPTSFWPSETIHTGWRLGDPHRKLGESDSHDYTIAQDIDAEGIPGPDLAIVVSSGRLSWPCSLVLEFKGLLQPHACAFLDAHDGGGELDCRLRHVLRQESWQSNFAGVSWK